MLAAEMNGVPPAKLFEGQGRDGNGIGLQIHEPFAQTREIGRVGEDGEISIAAICYLPSSPFPGPPIRAPPESVVHFLPRRRRSGVPLMALPAEDSAA